MGHIARNCNNGGAGGYGGGGGGYGGGYSRGGGGGFGQKTCYSCGGIGHMSREYIAPMCTNLISRYP